jgi:hypothetical protein
MDSNPASSLAQYGAIGVMLLVLGLFAKTLISREQLRSDRLESEVNRLNTLIQEKTIPALVSATQAIQASQQLLQAVQYQRDVDQRAREQRTDRE